MNARRFYIPSLVLASAVSALLSTGCSGEDSNGAGSGGSNSSGSGASGTAGSSSQGGFKTTGGETNVPVGGESPNSDACTFIVYDGEPGSAPSSEQGLVYVGWPMETNRAQDITDAKNGSGALQNVLDPSGTCCGTLYYSWTNWEKIPNKIIDATQFDSVELWIKIESGLYWNLQIELQDVTEKSSFTGNDIHIADFIEGKNIDMTWRHAKVPIDQFNTNGIDLTRISRMIIEGDRAVTFDLDDIQFTKDNCK